MTSITVQTLEIFYLFISCKTSLFFQNLFRILFIYLPTYIHMYVHNTFTSKVKSEMPVYLTDITQAVE